MPRSKKSSDSKYIPKYSTTENSQRRKMLAKRLIMKAKQTVRTNCKPVVIHNRFTIKKKLLTFKIAIRLFFRQAASRFSARMILIPQRSCRFSAVLFQAPRLQEYD